MRRHLFALVLAVLVPTLAFSAAASWATLREHAAAAEARMVDTANAYAAAITMQIRGQIAALSVLGAAKRLDGGDATRFELLARDTARIFGGWVVMLAPDGRIILNTAEPANLVLAPPGGRIDPEALADVRRTLETGQPVVTDLARGAQPGALAAFILLPVAEPDGPGRVIGMPLLPERLAAALSGALSGQARAVALTDSRGVFVAHSHDPSGMIGRQGPPRAAQDDGEPNGLMHGRAIGDGAALRIAWHDVEAAPGWTIWVNEPEEVFLAAMRGPILALVGGALLATLLGAFLARALSRRLLRPVEALVAHAEAVAVASQDPRPPALAPIEAAVPPSRVLEFERLRRAVTASERALREAEAQYRRVQEIGQVGGFLVDLSTAEPRRATGVVGLAGRPPLTDEVGHTAWLHRLHPEDRDRAEQYFRRVTADGAPDRDYVQSYRVLEADGMVRWISARAEIERDAAGRALRMIGAHVDITALKHAEAALRDGEERLRLALEAAEMGAWEADLRSGLALRTPRTLAIFGYGPEERIGPYPAWRNRIHVEDRKLLADAVANLRSGASDAYRVTYRFQRPDGEWRWLEIHARAAERDPITGEALRMIGTALDVTERREAEERQVLLTQEVDHRAKNALAVVNAALRLTPRDDADAFASTVEGRVAALARAHTLLAEARWTGADLRDVVAGEVSAFLARQDGAALHDGPLARLDGPAVPIGPTAVQALAMAFHELATNATKYGALSVPAGRLDIAWAVTELSEQSGNELRITWRETGAAVEPDAPLRRGFGSTLVEATIRRQLAGQMQVTWLPQGMLLEAFLPLERMQSEGQPRAVGRDLGAGHGQGAIQKAWD